MTEQVKGILSGLFGQLGAAGIKTPPVLEQKTLTITITEQELTAMALKDMDARYKNSVLLKCEQGKVIVTIQLW
jgi:hypothetical protein